MAIVVLDDRTKVDRYCRWEIYEDFDEAALFILHIVIFNFCGL